RQSPTAVLAGSASRATARTTMSRSVMTPMTLPSCTTGSIPTLASSIARAASVSDADGSTVTTSLTMISLTLRSALPFAFAPCAFAILILLQARVRGDRGERTICHRARVAMGLHVHGCSSESHRGGFEMITLGPIRVAGFAIVAALMPATIAVAAEPTLSDIAGCNQQAAQKTG